MESFRPKPSELPSIDEYLPIKGVDRQDNHLYDYCTFREACKWVLDNWSVHTASGDVPMREMLEYEMALDLLAKHREYMYRNKATGEDFQDIKIDFIDIILRSLTPYVMAVAGRTELGLNVPS